MAVTTATYSGRFMRPSSFRQATPMDSSSCKYADRLASFRLRGNWFLHGPLTP